MPHPAKPIRGALLPLGIAILTAAAATPAFAHATGAGHVSFLAGLAHPLHGLDHVLAMVSVGLWAGLSGGRSLVLVPAAFVAAMAAGFALALQGAALPLVEPVILASVVVLGLLAALAMRMPVAAGMALVATFAVFHGAAHGAELGGAAPGPYAAGFLLGTAALHAAGVGLALGLTRLLGSAHGRVLGRVAGAAVALGGVALAVA